MRIGNIELAFKGTGATAFLKEYKNHLDIIFAIAVLAIIAILIFPVPAWLMDVLLSVSISVSVLILTTVLFIDRSLDFNSFPSVLLVVTMLRLALNISSTRLILTNGHTGYSAAGHVIEAFGLFVMQGSIVIGIIVFAILTIINFVVITKGSGRIAEVAARFSLDAMPGKQMAIDADLSAGIIDEITAKNRRKELEAESSFYGAMDGANKFVRGDAIAGLIIIFINFIAGIIIGVMQKGMSMDSALQTYTLLTIGDGLVAQIPALIVSISAGLLVTKSGTQGSAEKAIFEQMGNFPHALGVTSGLLAFMALMPMIPALPFLTSAFVTGLLAYGTYGTKSTKSKDAIAGGQDATAAAAPAKSQEEILNEILQIDIIKLELGYELLPLINYAKGHKLPDQIKALRKQIAKELGFIIPPIRIQDNLQLAAKEYVIKVKDIECAKGTIEPLKFLVMDPKGIEIDLSGDDTIEPTFGLKAKWVDETLKEAANLKGLTVVDPPTIITTHITEVIKDNIGELFTISETQKLIDSLSADHKKLIGEFIPTNMNITTLQRILQGLLAEGISIRDLPTIIEAVSEVANQNKSVISVIEHVRSRLSKQLCSHYQGDKSYIPILMLSPKWEKVFAESLVGMGDDKQLSVSPSQLEEFMKDINKSYEQAVMQGDIPVLLTSAYLRPYIRSMTERFKSSLAILSQNEIHPKARIKTLGQV